MKILFPKIIVIPIMMIFSTTSWSQEVIDLFIVAGQSNAQGMQTNGVTNYPPDVDCLDPSIRLNWKLYSGYPTNTFSMTSSGWETMGNQLHYQPHIPANPGVQEHYGLEVTFARKLKKAGYNPAIFKFVFPGAGMKIWLGQADLINLSPNYYTVFKTALNVAIADLESQGKIVKVRGFVWIQGESDSQTQDAIDLYEDNLNFIIDDLRSEVQVPDLPVALGVNEIYQNGPNNMPAIIQIQNDIANSDPNIVYSTTAGLPTVNINHFNDAGVVEHGERIFTDLSSIMTASPAQNQNWELVWNDEFNASTLDATKWSAGNTDGRWEEWFNPANISIEAIDPSCPDNKELVLATNIQAHTTSSGTVKYFGGSEVSTSMLPDDPTANFKYGYYEARIKVAYNSTTENGRGYFPSFWLSVKNGPANNKTWPPELDVFEYSGWGDYRAHGTNQLITCAENQSSAKIDKHFYTGMTDAHSAYHIYGMEWNETEVKWYMDNILIGTAAVNDVPHDFFRIVLSNQLAHIQTWMTDPLGDLTSDNSAVHVDWVRVYKPIGAPLEKDYDKWDRVWTSGATEILGEWNLGNDDRHIAGDFTHDGIDEVLSISSSNVYAKLHQYDTGISDWVKPWGNGMSGAIGGWYLSSTDQFLTGNFDGQGDKLLCIDDIFTKLLEYDGSDWTTTWSNGGVAWLGGWPTGAGDRYFVYDFDANEKDDILCISADAKFYKIITYNGSGWTTMLGNGSGTGQIIYNMPVPKGGFPQQNLWTMKTTDSFLVGDFGGNTRGEILIIDEVDGDALLIEYTSSGLLFTWENVGGYSLGSWDTEEGSKYYAYKMDSDSKTELMCISPDNKYEKTLNFGGSTWYTGWENFGSYQIYNRDISNSDKFLFGNYSSSSTPEVLWVRESTSFPTTDDFVNYPNYTCGPTAYLHSMPDFTTLKMANGNIEDPEDEKLRNNVVNLYPNPNDGLFVIELGENENVGLSIYDAMGHEVYVNSNGSGKIGVDLSKQPRGIYIVKIKLGDEIITKKLIKK
ncbi:MAG: beta-glucanase (GH16 family) [Crocinitomicaceae bacterium]|jgi:beta-glucanase (GH16 family)